MAPYGLKTVERGYGGPHKQQRALWARHVASGGVCCWRCGGRIMPGEAWDLGHVDGDRSRYAGPEHSACNRGTNGRQPSLPVPLPDLERPEREGLAASDPVWHVPWLKGLRRVPRDATWPRLMTVPHPRATGSLGRHFVRFAERRSERPLRWWQKLAAARLLEVDDQGLLVWDAALLTMARQLGKSWLLRELCLWRIAQGDRFGEPQDVLHTGKDLAVCIEVQRPARLWAKTLPEYEVREANGKEMVGYRTNGLLGGRWLVKAKGAPYGFSVSLAVVDEAWNVETNYVEEGVAPTMVERVSPQLLLVSTAHRMATPLMLTRRKVALDELETGMGDLLIEWSSPRGAPIDDVRSWRLASPHWSAQREKLISRRLERMYAGETQDQTESDPAESFRAQWLNQWPKGATLAVGEELLPSGSWQAASETGLASDGPLFIAVEDDYGEGAAVAVAAELADGRLEVAGWLLDSWDQAVGLVKGLGEVRQVRQLQVGASLIPKVPLDMIPAPEPAGQVETKLGLPLFRDLVAGGMIVHDTDTAQLDEAVVVARVKEAATGLVLVPTETTHLVKALVWAVATATRPVPRAAVH